MWHDIFSKFCRKEFAACCMPYAKWSEDYATIISNRCNCSKSCIAKNQEFLNCRLIGCQYRQSSDWTNQRAFHICFFIVVIRFFLMSYNDIVMIEIYTFVIGQHSFECKAKMKKEFCSILWLLFYSLKGCGKNVPHSISKQQFFLEQRRGMFSTNCLKFSPSMP